MNFFISPTLLPRGVEGEKKNPTRNVISREKKKKERIFLTSVKRAIL